MSTTTSVKTELGQSIPANAKHGVSVSLPTWQDTVGYEEGEARVVNAMTIGYPRFYIHQYIRKLQAICEQKFGLGPESSLLFPSARIAEHFRSYMQSHSSQAVPVRVAHYLINPNSESSPSIELHIVLFPNDQFPLAKSFWQHTGAGISSRMAEHCLSLLPLNDLQLDTSSLPPPAATPSSPIATRARGGKKFYHTSRNSLKTSAIPLAPSETRENSTPTDEITPDVSTYLEERYGRNLPASAAAQAKRALRRRIAGVMFRGEKPADDSDLLTAEKNELGGSKRGGSLSEDDVFLYPCGMNAIWNSHQLALATRPSAKSVCFGFPYTDTYKILQKWGPGCHFFGHGLDSDIDELATILSSNRSASPGTPPILALFCEFPSNPLLRSPNLARLRALADEYDFLIIVDETVGSFPNIDVLTFADVVVSSLTKVFSGEGNAMGGSLVLNPQGRHYSTLAHKMAQIYEDTYWAEDAIYMERNSRDLVSRVHRINHNTETVCEILRSKSLVFLSSSSSSPSPPLPPPPPPPPSTSTPPIVIKEVFYPKWVTRENYDACRTPDEGSGYSGLFSLTFTSPLASRTFFDALGCDKGPSLGTNFTLACPYTILAHYSEIEWAEGYGVERGLVRVSVGMEDEETLRGWFEGALRVTEEVVARAVNTD